jgi:WD40 repeat protein
VSYLIEVPVDGGVSSFRPRVYAVAWSPDGGLLATVSEDGTARVWDAVTGATRSTLSGHGGAVQAVAWSPDGGLLATASGDGTARVWDAVTGRLVITLLSLPDGDSAALFADGSYALDGDPCDVLWWAMKLCRFAPGELDEFVPGLVRRQTGDRIDLAAPPSIVDVRDQRARPIS